jgi:SAM-dependent methyltransferase
MIPSTAPQPSCCLCGNSSLIAMPTFQHVHLVCCSNCNFHFSARPPTTEELTALYALYQRHDGISPITIKRYNEILDALEPFRKTNNIIDVGCGNGHFLQTAAKRGWIPYGIEATKEAVAMCEQKGIAMKLGALSTDSFPGVSFDVVTSFEVLEHLWNPREEVEKFKSILRTGGAVYATTPNFNSLSRHLLKDRWNVITYPEHLCYFSRRSIKKLFSAEFFSLSDCQTTGISITRFRSAQSGSPQGDHQNWDEKVREQSESRPLLKLAKMFANFLLNVTSKGDALKATFVKM